MSEEKKSVRDLSWAKNVPEYMVDVIDYLTDLRDDVRELLAAANRRDADSKSSASQREQTMTDQQTAFAHAVDELRSLYDRMLGPESEIVAIKQDITRHASTLSDLQNRVSSLESRRAL